MAKAQENTYPGLHCKCDLGLSTISVKGLFGFPNISGKGSEVYEPCINFEYEYIQTKIPNGM